MVMITNIIKSVGLTQENALWYSILLILVSALLIAIIRTMSADRLERSYKRYTRRAGLYHPPAPQRAVFIAQVFWALFWISFVIVCAGVGAVIVAAGG